MKRFFYNQVKNLSTTLDIPVRGRWVGTTAQYWETQLNKLKFRSVLSQVRRRVPNVIQFTYRGGTAEDLIITIRNKIRRRGTENINYYFNFLDADNIAIRLRRNVIINSNSLARPFYNLHSILSSILENPTEYDIQTNHIVIQMHKEVTENSPLRNQRDGSVNCACKAVLSVLNKHKQSDRVKRKIKNVNKLNKKYLKDGIDEEGLQLLADQSQIKLVIKDKIGEKWNEFTPKSKKDARKLLLCSHNNHISTIYDSDDEEDEPFAFGEHVELKEENMPEDAEWGDEIVWFDKNQDLLDKVEDYEKEQEGRPIISKGKLIAYITDKEVWKTKFNQFEEYPDCFTSGGVGKSKFVEQYPEYKYGCDNFHSLLMDADTSGFYSRTGESKEEHTKYDQNKAYKSFATSGLFKGFPVLEAVFKVDKLFSELCLTNGVKAGLLYVEADRLSATNNIVEKLNQPIYYECSGWYPVEIVSQYYKEGIDPFIRSYAYANESFNVDFSTFTNDQFRTFIGKCTSKSYDEIWKTKDYLEFMRARYILRDRILNFTHRDGVYQIVYASDRKPWNMPVVSVYVKAHQKYNLFKQYNKLIKSGILPVAVSVDGIEVVEKCDELFDCSSKIGNWKLEGVYTGGNTEASVIERIPVEPRGTLQFSKDLILPKFLHISGAGGNGKSNKIIELAKAYPNLMFMTPTNDAAKNLIDRGKELGVKIKVDTYHRVFGFGCVDIFPRDKYDRFVLDECSLLSAENLKIIMGKLKPTQKLLLAGDFWQLPCIHDTPIYDNWTGVKSTEYKQFEVMELTKNWRQQEDSEFFNLCQSLRGKLTKDEALNILKVLNSRVVSTLPENTTTDDIHICGINTQVNAINKNYKLEEGCKVICNAKCYDKEKQLVPNGSIGIIKSMIPFEIKWSDAKNGVSTFKAIGKNASGASRFTPAYGLTIHKAQGKTIKRNVIINPSRLFAKNHLYVALTRATKFSSVFFTEAMSFDTFCRTVNVYGDCPVVPKSNARLERMVSKYKVEDPNINLQFLETMKKEQKNKCCYCGVNMCDLFGQPQSITLERIDDTKKHIISNVKLACFGCNSAHRK